MRDPLADMGIEIAIRAFGQTERPMHINAERTLPNGRGSGNTGKRSGRHNREKFT
jgi:hypothetical protein